MQCKNCGTDLVRGFSFCLECGMPVPSEMLEESGLPQRNIDRGPEEAYSTADTDKSVGEASVNPRDDEPVGDLKPKLIGGEQERGTELKPQLIGGESFTQGKALKPKLMGVGEDEAGEALRPKLMGGEEEAGSGAKVRAAMHDSSADANDVNSEKLVFCPNCGMHMQHDPNKCNICGMPLGSKPNNVTTTSGGIPLFNTESDTFSGMLGTGDFGGFGDFSGISDEDAALLDNFANGNPGPMFNSGGSALNVQATPDDFAQLTEQLANFSAAAGISSIETTKNVRIRQKEPKKGQEREVSDFLMSDDLSDESIPISDDSVPIINDYSMEENPDADIVIDPYAFIHMSMDEDMPSSPKPQPQKEASADIPEAVPANKPSEEVVPANKPSEEVVPANQPSEEVVPVNHPSEVVPVIDDSRFDPVPPPFFSETDPEDIVPFIAEEAPVITEFSMPAAPRSNSTVSDTDKTAADIENTPSKPDLPEPLTAAVPQRAEARRDMPVQQARSFQQTQPVQPAQPVQQFGAVQPVSPAAAANTKKCNTCGQVLAFNDVFCPNCGRSLNGAVNPNYMNYAPIPARSGKNPTAIIIIIALVVLAVIAVVLIVTLNGNAAEICLNEFSDAVSNSGQTFTESITESRAFVNLP